MLTLVGGKWTTYRACAEQIADEVLKRLNLTRTRSTLDAAIGGGAGHAREAAARNRQIDDVARANGLDTAIAARLVNRYGTQAGLVAQAIAAPGGRETVDDRGLYHVGEIGWILANERVTRLSDIVLRRTLMPFEGAVTLAGLERLAQIAGHHLGWSPERQAQEVAQTADRLATRHRVPLSPLKAAAA